MVEPESLQRRNKGKRAVCKEGEVGNPEVFSQRCLQELVVVTIVREPLALPNVLQKLRELLQRREQGRGYGDGLLPAVRRVLHGGQRFLYMSS